MSEDLKPLVEALQRKLNYLSDRVDELEAENQDLRETVAEMERVIDPDPGAMQYDKLSRSEKVFRIRKSLAQQAARSQDGTARMQYDDVQWLFDGHPSRGHVYDLMERAAGLDGFEYDKPAGSGGKYRIRVDLAAVKDETLIHAVTTTIDEEAV